MAHALLECAALQNVADADWLTKKMMTDDDRPGAMCVINTSNALINIPPTLQITPLN